MSSPASWKNAIPRRTYRERGQLKAREHLGLLEKKRDYKRRAKDFQQKRHIIKNLSEKALGRNPDEFYHKMTNAVVQDGQNHTILKGKEQEKIKKLNEGKDISLVNLKRMVEKNKAQKIQNSLHLLDMPKRNQHIHFISNKSELKQPLTARKGTTDEEDGLATGKRLNNERDAYIAQLKSNQSQNKGQYKKLADALLKEQQFERVQEALVLDKHLKEKGKKRKMVDEDTGRTSFKWFRERKR